MSEQENRKLIIKRTIFISSMAILFVAFLLLAVFWEDIDSPWNEAPPYFPLSRSELESVAQQTALRISNDDLLPILENYDRNAFHYFYEGRTDVIDLDEQQEWNERLEEDLENLRECSVTRCFYSPNEKYNSVEFSLLYKNGQTKKAMATFYKGKDGEIGLATFGFLNE